MSGFTVLVVDGSLSVRRVIKNALSTLPGGVRIVEAGDGDSAVRLYKLHLADLVLMDVTLPGANGIEALAAIKAFDTDAQVVMLTAESSLDIVVKARELKADGFIAKPFEAARITRLVLEHRARQPKPIHVLLADDARSIRMIVRRSLLDLPLAFRIREAVDGAEAVTMAEARPADLIFLDIHMPNQGGLEALEHIRRFSPDGHIAMLTTDASAAVVSEAKSLGANDYILKPFSADQLAAIVWRFVAARDRRIAEPISGPSC